MCYFYPWCLNLAGVIIIHVLYHTLIQEQFLWMWQVLTTSRKNRFGSVFGFTAPTTLKDLYRGFLFPSFCAFDLTCAYITHQPTHGRWHKWWKQRFLQLCVFVGIVRRDLQRSFKAVKFKTCQIIAVIPGVNFLTTSTWDFSATEGLGFVLNSEK